MVAADRSYPERSQRAALLSTSLCAGHYFGTHERFLLSLSNFLLLLLWVNELVPDCAAGIKPLHEDIRLPSFLFCQRDRGIAGWFPTLR